MPENNLVKPEFGSLVELATKIKGHHQAVRDAAKNVVARAIAAGHSLNEAKSKLPHGEWLPWLKDHCELSERTAHNYMLLANNRHKIEGSKSAIDANLRLNQALRQIEDGGGRAETGPASRYDKAQATLIKKLGELLPDEVEAAAKRTIAELEAAITKPVNKAVA
jgi:Protein of unknown function (DUF3102)